MRQTGRTSRIVNFAVGEVVVTDHSVFECPNVRRDSLVYFADKVRERVKDMFHHQITGTKIYLTIIQRELKFWFPFLFLIIKDYL